MDSNWFKLWPTAYLNVINRIPDGTQRAEFLLLAFHCLNDAGLPDNDDEIAFNTGLSVDRVAGLRPYLNRLASIEDGRIMIKIVAETIQDTTTYNAYVKSLRGDWPAIRLQTLERDEWTCNYCGGWANTVDHIIPRKRGGGHDSDNLVAACKSCNSRKRDQTPDEAGMVLASRRIQ